MFMDLYEKDAATALQPQPNEAHSLPATGEAAFGAAWNEAKLFSQSSPGRTRGPQCCKIASARSGKRPVLICQKN